MFRPAALVRALGAPSRRLLLRPQFKPQFAAPAVPTLHVARRHLATSTDGTPASSTPNLTAEQQEAQQQAALETQQQESDRQEILQQEIAQTEYAQEAQQEKLEQAQPIEGAAETQSQPSEPAPTPRPNPNLPYHVGRTPTDNLAIYQKSMRGGTLKITNVKKITGDREALRVALRAGLGLEDKDVRLNQLTGNIKIKGFVREQVQKWLEEKGF